MIARFVLFALLATGAAPCAMAQRHSLEDGSVRIVADATMGPLIERLHRMMAQSHPEVRFTVIMRPPPAGLDGITAGVSLLAPIAYDPSEGELEPFKRLTGHAPLDIRIGRLGYTAPGRENPPAIYVNAANPLRDIDLEMLSCVFTAGGKPGDVRRWSQLGVEGGWAAHAIHLYGRRDDGSFATTLRAKLFDRRPFAAHYEPLPTDADVLEAVAFDHFGIGFAGFVDPAVIPAGVRMLGIAREAGGVASTGAYDDVRDGRYPLSPGLHLYLRSAPGEKLEPLAREYIRLALSPEGQEAIAALRDGPQAYVPLSAGEARRELAKVEGK